jgi:hypothetical protein
VKAHSERTSAHTSAESRVPEVHYGLVLGLILDGHCDAVSRFFDAITPTLGKATGRLVHVRKLGHSAKNDATYRKCRSAKLRMRDEQDATTYQEEVAKLGGDEWFYLTGQGAEVRKRLGVSDCDPPFLLFQTSPDSAERAILPLPPALFETRSARKELEKILCAELSERRFRTLVPACDFETPESMERVKEHIAHLAAQLAEFAEMSGDEGSHARLSRTSKDAEVYCVAYTDGECKSLDQEGYRELIRDPAKYKILLDGIEGKVFHQDKGWQAVRSGYIELLRAAITSKTGFDPTADCVPGYPRAARESFQEARRQVDVRTDHSSGTQSWLLFKTRLINRRAVYWFRPEAGAQYALVFRSDRQ